MDKLVLNLCRLVDDYRALIMKYCITIKEMRYKFDASIMAQEIILFKENSFEKQKQITLEEEFKEILRIKNEKIKELEDKYEIFQEKSEEVDILTGGMSYLEGEIDILKEENQKLADDLEKFRKTYDDLLR